MNALAELMAFQRETSALAQVAGRLNWDQETMMPRGAAAQRAEESAAMQAVLHGRRTDPRVAEWLEAAQPGNAVERAHIRDIRRDYERTAKVPVALARALARETALAQGVWAEARARDDFAAFVPSLTEVLRLRRE